METKEYYRAFISVIEYVAAGNSVITLQKGEELSGGYWPRIHKILCIEKIGLDDGGGEIYISRGQYLTPIYEDCKHALEEIARREADRELDNAAKRTNIRYAKRAYWISIVSIIVAISALVWQIIIQIRTA